MASDEQLLNTLLTPAIDVPLPERQKTSIADFLEAVDGPAVFDESSSIRNIAKLARPDRVIDNPLITKEGFKTELEISNKPLTKAEQKEEKRRQRQTRKERVNRLKDMVLDSIMGDGEDAEDGRMGFMAYMEYLKVKNPPCYTKILQMVVGEKEELTLVNNQAPIVIVQGDMTQNTQNNTVANSDDDNDEEELEYVSDKSV